MKSYERFKTPEQEKNIAELGIPNDYFSYGDRYVNNYRNDETTITTGYALVKFMLNTKRLELSPNGLFRVWVKQPYYFKDITIDEARQIIEKCERLINFK